MIYTACGYNAEVHLVFNILELQLLNVLIDLCRQQ